ncbi:MAG: hypothetical protein JO252_00470 [Planctomycetaceae bacterium]|nr:hypothetical protein [Planctomycetaceae bacterium]
MACRRLGRAVDLERLRRVFGLAPADTPVPLRPARPPAPPASAAAPTPGQVAWLGTLTAEERAHFDALPERSRARFLEWHREGVNPDPILAGEAARVLRPKGRAAAGDEPGGTFAVMGGPAHPRRAPER